MKPYTKWMLYKVVTSLSDALGFEASEAFGQQLRDAGDSWCRGPGCR